MDPCFGKIKFGIQYSSLMEYSGPGNSTLFNRVIETSILLSQRDSHQSNTLNMYTIWIRRKVDYFQIATWNAFSRVPIPH